MALEPNELARRNAGSIHYRAEPLRMRVELTDLITADHNNLRVMFECSVRAGDPPADRKMLAEMFLAQRPSATCDDVNAFLAPRLRTSAESAVGGKNASELLSDQGRAVLLAAVRKAADEAAFAAGLLILSPFSITVSSPSIAHQQIEAMERARAEATASGRIEHLRHAADLLKQFETIRADAPNVSAGQLLETIAPADRGGMLESLLAASGTTAVAKTLYAVAGPYLVAIDPRERPSKPQLISLPTTLGPLRSVQSADVDGRTVLLVGARGGFLLVDPKNPATADAYPDPDLNSQLGFNRVVFWNRQTGFWATHGEGGIVAWGVGNTEGPHTKIRDFTAEKGGGPRNLQVVDSKWAVFSIGNQLVFMDAEDRSTAPPETDAPIVAIVPDATRLFVIHEDGLVCTIERATRTITRRDPRGGPVSAAVALPWLDGIRLLLACEGGAIDCIGTDDSLVTRYNSSYRGLRDLAASADTIAAVSPDRQRLLIWDSWAGRSPAVDLHVTSMTRHRIADIAFA